MPGSIETTALVLTALSRWRKQTGDDPQTAALIDRATLFLLRSKDEYGTWLTTQATVRAFLALLESLAPALTQGPERLEIYLNGAPAGDVRLPDSRTVQGPITVD